MSADEWWRTASWDARRAVRDATDAIELARAYGELPYDVPGWMGGVNSAVLFLRAMAGPDEKRHGICQACFSLLDLPATLCNACGASDGDES